jgi:uncharacterized protein (DUF427 family)
VGESDPGGERCPGAGGTRGLAIGHKGSTTLTTCPRSPGPGDPRLLGLDPGCGNKAIEYRRSCESPPRARRLPPPYRSEAIPQRASSGLIVHPPWGAVPVGELLQFDWYEPKPASERNSHVVGAVVLAMTPGHTISIVPTVARVEVRIGGRLLASTDRAMKLDETGLPARYYLPPDDVQMDLLRPTTFHTTCPFKGEASYWSLDIDGELHDGIVWSYERPTAQAAEVRGMLSFYTDRTEVTVDGQSLRD